MTSKHLYFKLFREDLKRKLWAGALLALAFFFSLPVPMAMVLPSYKLSEYVTMEQIIVRRTNNVRTMLGFGTSYPVVAMLLFIAAVVMGIATFSYLHNKKQIDFYHSLPVKRSLWFLVNISTGIFLPAAVYLAAIVLSLVVSTVNGVMPGLALSAAVSGFLLNMLYYTLTYITVVLAMMLTGTKIAAILGSAVFFSFFPAVNLLIRAYFQTFFQTYYDGVQGIFFRSLVKLSPISAIALALEKIDAGRIFSTVAAIILLSLLAFFLYEKRPSEAAGKTMAFNCSKGLIKVPLVLAFGIAGALFFHSIESSLGWTIFGNIVGIVLSHCIIEVIYWGDFKKVFCHEKTLAACLAVSLAVLFSFYFDLFHYDTYVPKESQVAYASVDFNRDNWVTSIYDDPELEGMGVSVLQQGKIEDSTLVMALVREAIQQMEIEEQEGDAGRDRLQKENLHRCRMDVCYTLKNRRKVYRTYAFYLDPVMDEVDKIYTDAAYKQALYPGLRLDEAAAENIVYRDWNDNIQHLEGSKEQQAAVLRAYQEEMTAMPLSQRKEENPFAEILLISSEDIANIENRRKTDDKEAVHYQWGWYEGYYYPVYPSFAKTIQALEDCGVELKELFVTEDVEDITISGYGPFDGAEELDADIPRAEMTKSADEREEEAFCQNIYDRPEDIEKILPVFIRDEKGWRNGMAETDNRYEIVVKLKGKGKRIYHGYFKLNAVPDFVAEDFVAIEKELKENLKTK